MSGISKLDYLKRYMDDSAEQKKKIKKKSKLKILKSSNIKIVDNDITFKNPSDRHLVVKHDDEDDDEFDLMEEKPILFAADGATILTKDYEEKVRQKNAKWQSFSNKTGLNKVLQFDKSATENRKTISVKKGYDTGENLSPVQIGNQLISDGDLSPQRPSQRVLINRKMPRTRHDSDDGDISPERKRRHDSSASDLSPERVDRAEVSPRRICSDDDLSPMRESAHDKKGKTPQYNRKEENPEIMSTGRKAGIQSGKELKEENRIKREKEAKQLSDMDISVSGERAATVYRDRKTGKKIDVKLEELKKIKQEEEKQKEKEKQAVWGKGVTQTNEYTQKLNADLHEADKPLARYKDDQDLDKLLKLKDREGDPMLAYLAKKKEKTSVSKTPRYNGPTPPANRFNLWPGYRYDGVDRSNGFEKKRFMAISKHKALTTDAYKWSVEDM